MLLLQADLQPSDGKDPEGGSAGLCCCGKYLLLIMHACMSTIFLKLLQEHAEGVHLATTNLRPQGIRARAPSTGAKQVSDKAHFRLLIQEASNLV